jgi:hypothetical protein
VTDTDVADVVSTQLEEGERLFSGTLIGQIRAVSGVALMLPQGKDELMPLIRVAIKLENERAANVFAGSWPEMLGLLSYVSNVMAEQIDLLSTLRSSKLLFLREDHAELARLYLASLSENITKIEDFLGNVPASDTVSEPPKPLP